MIGTRVNYKISARNVAVGTIVDKVVIVVSMRDPNDKNGKLSRHSADHYVVEREDDKGKGFHFDRVLPEAIVSPASK